MLRDKMLAVMTDLRRDVVEREELIEAIAIALLTRKNLFILGDPGQAKSFVINGFRSRITGARQFERLLTKQADEEQLFGRTDLSSLIPGHVPQSVLEQDATYRRLRGELEAVVALMPTQPDDPEAYEQMAAATERLEAYKKAVASLYRSEPIRDVHRGGQSAQPQQYPIVCQQLLPHRRRQATRQDDRGVLPGGQKGDRAIPGARGLLHPVRLQQSLHHGAVGREDPDTGGKETPLREHPAPRTFRAG